MKHIRHITLIVLAILMANLAQAQNIYEGNPADPMLLEAAFSNPALNAYIKDRAVLAMTAHHVGIGGGVFAVRSGVLSYHLPWQLRGLAVGGQFFTAGLYSQSDFRISYGQRILPPLCVGANVDVFIRSYDKAKFFRFTEGDPVFAEGYGRINTSWGLGVLVEVYQSLNVGLAFEHLNRPDLAVGSDPFHQPMMFSLGLKWHMRGWNVTSQAKRMEMAKYSRLEFRRAVEDAPQATQLGAEVPIGRSWLRVNSDPAVVQLEAEVPLYRSLYVNYRYGYPLTDINLASAGTQRFGFVYDFNRLPRPSALPALPARPMMRDEIPALKGKPRGLFFVYADADTVDVIERHVRRSIDSELPPASLSLLLPEDLGHSPTWSRQHLQEVDLMNVRDPIVRPSGFYSTQYRSALEGIGLQARAQDSRVQPEIISYPGGERRANALANLITGDHIAVPAKVPIYTTDERPAESNTSAPAVRSGEEVQQVISPDHVTFRLVSIFCSLEQCRWTLDVRNVNEERVFSSSGSGELPDSLTWDWRGTDGKILAPGSYSYRLSIADRTGKIEYSDRGMIDVLHRRQSLTVDVTRRMRVGEVPADKYILIVGAGRTPFTSLPSDTTNGATK